MAVYSLDGITPVVHPGSFVHETAVLIGDVIVGAGCYIGPGACLRGDFGRIVVGDGANVQDNCVMHSFPDKDCVIEANGHIGHGAVLHGCTVGRNAMVGMNAVVMDNAVIAEESIVAASAFVSAGFECKPRSLIMGVPAKVKRSLSEQEVDWKTRGTGEYQELTRRCQASLIKTGALTEVEENRGRMKVGNFEFKPDQPAQYASPACFSHELDPGTKLENNEPIWDKVKGWRKQQRDRLIAIRDSLDDAQHKVMSQSIGEHLQASGWLDNRNSIAFFWPMTGEIDLRPLVIKLVEQGVTAALPVITKRNQPLEFWQWLPDETLNKDGLWGIPVPPVRRPIHPEVLLVPMLGFDNQGHRLGFGGGYYDRSIAQMMPQPVCIGVCCEYGHMHSIYPQAHDVPMHAVASESQFRVFNKL